MTKMTTEFAPKIYVMDPETEDILYGDQLKKNMVVLIWLNEYRQDPSKQNNWDAQERAEAAVMNRWCLITDEIRQLDNGKLSFIGMYADGSKSPRVHGPSASWYVKKDSMAQGSPFSQDYDEDDESSVELDDQGK